MTENDIERGSDSDNKNSNKVARLIKIGVLILVVILIGSLMITNTPKTKDEDTVWDSRTVLGSSTAKNHYIMYTDIMCPYCSYFSKAAMKSWDEFEQYMKDNDVQFEVRVTDFLYEYNGVSPYSTDAAEATYCATDQDKFWDYYHAELTAIQEDYYDKGIGNAKGAEAISDLPSDYWLNIGHKIGLSGDFDNCVKNHTDLAKVQDNTKETAKQMQKLGQGGLPLFKFNDFIQTGFDPNWDYSYVKQYLDAGLKK